MKLFHRLFSQPQKTGTAKPIAIRAGSVVTEIGPPDILHGLFSTISANLESAGWGSRFPLCMSRLYQGRLQPEDCPAALEELRMIADELARMPVSNVVWEIERPDRPPNPRYTLGTNAANAAEFFVTVNGLDLLRAGLIEAVESAVEFGHPVEIVALDSALGIS